MRSDRRRFLSTAGVGAAALVAAPSVWLRALAAPAKPGPSPYGELGEPDDNGLQLPPGFTSRVVAVSLAPVGTNAYLWHPFPDGGACLPRPGGGWIYISNSENPPPADVPGSDDLLEALALAGAAAGVRVPANGGVSVLEFGPDGTVGRGYSILDGSISNCAGGLTPWGTWLSCEEWETDDVAFSAGLVYECAPFGGPGDAVARPALGRFKHEMAACDPVRQVIYLSEDQSDGLFYRYVPKPGTWGSGAALEGGTLQAMRVGPGDAVSWIDVAPFMDPAAPTGPLREAVTGATPFVSGEGVVYDQDKVFLTTKPPSDKVWVYDIVAGTMTVLYAAPEAALDGVDNIIVSGAHELYVAEDGGNLEVNVITPDQKVFTVVRMTGSQHGAGPLPGEVTGLALSPDGNRLYFNSERGNGGFGLATLPGPGPGILYEVTGPFRGGTLAAAQAATTTTTAASPTTTTPGAGGGVAGGSGSLPATGGLGAAAGVAAALAAVALAARRALAAAEREPADEP